MRLCDKQKIKDLVETISNDFELGKTVREILTQENDIVKHFPNDQELGREIRNQIKN